MASSKGKKGTATAKRRAGTGSTAGNRTGKRTSASGRAKSDRSRISQEELRAMEVRRDIRLLLFFGVMAFVMIAELGYGGAAGKAVSAFMFGVFGTPAYIVPVFMFAMVLFIISNLGRRTLAARTVSLIMLLVDACAAFEFWGGEVVKAAEYNASDIYQRCAASKEGGGLIGGTAVYWLYRVFKSVGSVFMMVMVALVCILVLTQFSPVARYRKAQAERIRRGDPSFMERRRLRAEESRARSEERREAAEQEKREREELLLQEQLNREERRRKAAEKADSKPEDPPGAADLFNTVIRPAEEEEEEDFGLDEGSYLFRKNDKKAKREKRQTAAAGVSEISPIIEETGNDSAHGIRVIDRGRSRAGEAEEIRVRAVVQSPPDRQRRRQRQTEADLQPAAADLRQTAADLRPAAGEPRPKQQFNMEQITKDPGPATVTVFTRSREAGGTDKELRFPFDEEQSTRRMRRVYAGGDIPGTDPEPAATDPADAGGLSAFNAMNAQRVREEERPAAKEEPSVPEEQLRDIEVHRDRGDEKGRTAGRTAASGQSRSKENRKYSFPPYNLMEKGARTNSAETDRELKETAFRLQETLRTFGVNVKISDISQGPSVTRYELVPEQGVKVSKIVSLANDIKLSLAAVDIRIEAPIPGKPAIGIEVPNTHPTVVALRDILETQDFRGARSKLAFAVGKDLGGQTVVTDISKMPHLLIAGATGSGKSVCINTIIMSILYKASPDEVQLIMIDPKVVELNVYNGIPHLMIPVVTDVRKASAALNWAVAEMERRYKLFATAGMRDLNGYNSLVRSKGRDAGENEKVLPRIVVIVDELADLMMVAKADVESAICRLAQLARAAGIHLIIATQRPSVDVITGLIKANMPSRIAFAVTSQVDSRTILDMAGAEKLIGKGDMLFYPQNYQKPARIQGAFISDEDVMKVVSYIKQNNASYKDSAEDIDSVIDNIAANGGSDPDTEIKGGSGFDEYFADAGRFIIEKNKASIGMLQRVFKIGFNRAARIMDQLAEAGVVSEENGTKARQVLMDMPAFEQYLEEM